jgi:hypothetical protein
MKRSPWFHILGLICTVGVSIACATLVPGGQATPTIPIESISPTFTPIPNTPDDETGEKGDTGDSRWTDLIDKAEGEWQALGITSYRIEVMVASIWHAQTYKLTVREGEVVEESASCIPAPTESGVCEVQPFDAADYTVPGLFEYARSKAIFEGGKFTQITFDPNYSFPVKVFFDNPDIIDEESSWRVTTFEVLE